MKILKHTMALIGAWLLALPVLSQSGNTRERDLQLLAENVFHLSEIMLHDVAAPTAASRFYAYSMLGAYQVALVAGADIPNVNPAFKVPLVVKAPSVPKTFDLSFTSIYAMLDVGRQIMPPGSMLAEKQKRLIEQFKTRGLSERALSQNVRFAEDVALQVIRYARSDDYNKLSTYPRYTPSKAEGHWYPTPPEYMGALDPQWCTVRSFFLDSAGQFAPPPPAQYSAELGSDFYKQMREVYDAVNSLTPQQREIANFWDCNPFAVTYSGHMAIGLKKISPGGHWMGISGIACKKANVSLDSAIMVHTLVALTLHDAFISCWKEKYLSDRIRPEGAINKLLDSEWRPILQTPPFPEYSSGHSVASSSAAVVLTHLLGDNFEFVDDSEVYFGLPVRAFNSFYEASNEAAISRLYGGIHFRDACDHGVVQGKKIGTFVINQVFNTLPNQE